MGLILDTSVLIGAERDAFDLVGLLAAEQQGEVAMAAITASELLHGVERARDPALRAHRQRAVEGLLDAFPALPFSLPEARIHARLWAALAAKGRMIGVHDLQVAATALSAGHALATLNQRDFKRVPGLVLRPVATFIKA